MIFAVVLVINWIILSNFDQITALVELPKVEDNDIIKAESIIRNTTNKLFSTLKFHGKKENPDLSQLSLIHSYLVTLTLKDYDSLNEVAKLTRVGNSDFNVLQNFIDVLNEIVDDNEIDTKIADDATEDDIVKVVTDYMHNLAYITNFMSTNSPQIDLRHQVVKYFDEKVHDKDSNRNMEKVEDNSIDGGLLTWKPATRRIYQGKRTKIRHFPFMASVEVLGKFTCAGSIIEDDLVITAASCLQLAWNNRFYRENPHFLKVRIGSTFFESGGEKVEVLEVYFHPGYDPGSLHNNLAVMRLRRKIRFSRHNSKRVMKIEFDRNDHRLPSNTDGITVVGWGAKSSTNVIHNAWEQRLSYDILPIYALPECQEVYSKVYVTGKHFCTGLMAKGSGACNRDVGGPGVVDGILTGIMSFGSPVCGAADSPTVFTKVGFYADWIEKIMDQPVVVGSQITTTEIPFDYNLAWEHLTTERGKATLIYRTKYTPIPYVEAVTPEERVPEKDILRLLDTILRNDKKKGLRFESDENVLKTKKITTLSPLKKKILNLFRQSRKAEDATERTGPTTLMTGNLEPIVPFESDDSDTDYEENSQNVTVIDVESTKSVVRPKEKNVKNQHKRPVKDKTLRQKIFVGTDDVNKQHSSKVTVLDVEQTKPVSRPKELNIKIQRPVKGETLRQKLFEEKSQDSQYEQVLNTELQDVGDNMSKTIKDAMIEEPRITKPHIVVIDEVPKNEKSLKSDDVVFALLYPSDEEKDNSTEKIIESKVTKEYKESKVTKGYKDSKVTKDNKDYKVTTKYEDSKVAKGYKDSGTTVDDKNNRVLEMIFTNSSSKSMESDDYETINEGLAILRSRNKENDGLLSRKDANALTRTTLSDAELFEILSEAIREAFNNTLPELTTSVPDEILYTSTANTSTIATK